MRLVRALPALLLRALPPALLLPALLLSPPLAAQQVYTWKDAAGVTHFTSEPPPDRHYEAREVDHHQAAPVAAAADPGTSAARAGDPGCATARSNLTLLAGEGPLSMDRDGTGKSEVLSDADRARQRTLAQAIIDARCGGNAAAAPAPAPQP